ncbi:MAG: DUF4230 domain-containing protein [Actinocatenispora sp.]
MTRSEPRRPEPVRRRWPAVIALVLIVALAAALVRSLNVVSWPPNPFEEKKIDRSQPVLLQSIQQLSRYEAAAGNFQVVIDLEHDARFLPSSVRGDRTLFVAAGTVDAYVDFSSMGKDALTINKTRTAVKVQLPHAALEKANLDQKHSHVVAQQKGLLDRFQSFLGDDSDDEHQLYVLAQKKIGTAARSSKLAAQAERNTRAMLTGMLRSLGYTSVTVTFGEPES